MLFPFAVRFCASNTVYACPQKILFGVAIGVLALPAVTALAAEVPSLPDAQRLAVAHSRQLPAQDSAAVAARGMAAAAGQLPDPTLKFGIDNLPVTSSDRFSLKDDFMTMRRKV